MVGSEGPGTVEDEDVKHRAPDSFGVGLQQFDFGFVMSAGRCPSQRCVLLPCTATRKEFCGTARKSRPWLGTASPALFRLVWRMQERKFDTPVGYE